MAFIVDYALTESTAGATSFSANVPPHQTNDILLVSFTADASYTLDVTGFTQIGTTQAANSAVCTGVFWKRAASSSETITCTMNSADAYAVCVLCIRDADTGASVIDASSATNSGTTAASQITSVAVTTTVADCLVIYIVGKDGIANQSHTNPGSAHHIISHDSGGSTATTSAAQGLAWYFQRATGATPTPTWTNRLSAVTNFFTIAIRNASGGRIPAYVDDSTACGTAMIHGHHASTLNNLTYDAALSLTDIGPNGSGKATTFDAVADQADYGINPYSAANSSTPAATAATSAAGYQVTFTNTHDVSTDFIVGSVIAANPKMANYNHGSIVQGGTFITVADASNNYRSFQVLARDASPNTEGRVVFSVQPNQTSTQYGYSSTPPTLSALKKILFLSNNPTATITLYYAEIHRARTHIIAGGDTNNPVDSEGLAQVGRSFRIPLIQKSGAAGLLSYVPIQVGGGDAVNFQVNAGSLQFPRIYNTTAKQINFHAADNTIGISYAGKSGDVIKHSNSVVTSASPYYWEINSAATSAATWDFAGLVVVGATVTLRNVMTFSGMTFSSCPSIDASDCTLDRCTISNVPTTNDSLTSTAGTLIKNSSINVTTVTAGNRWCTVTTPVRFETNTFTGSASAGHAIRITTAGTYAFIGNTFTNFGATGSTSAAIYNDSGGSVTLNISGGGNSPTYRNGTGASTTVAVSATLTIEIRNSDDGSLITQNCEITVVKVSDESVLFHEDDITDGITAYAYSSGAGTAVYINVLNVAGYQNKTVYQTLGTGDETAKVFLDTDRIYSNP
ncbi:hypothetical protein HY440_00010 [Candidatus Microgenomates bacterium]|nr:hypothetical protein [Candidatus Microgenomates bacterium]